MLEQVVRLAREMGRVKLGTIAVDGTKIKVNASRHKAMSFDRMFKAEAELQTKIKALLYRVSAADEAEKNEPELDISAKIARRQDRLERIVAAKPDWSSVSVKRACSAGVTSTMIASRMTREARSRRRGLQAPLRCTH